VNSTECLLLPTSARDGKTGTGCNLNLVPNRVVFDATMKAQIANVLQRLKIVEISLPAEKSHYKRMFATLVTMVQ
jgi:hypothetical protein